MLKQRRTRFHRGVRAARLPILSVTLPRAAVVDFAKAYTRNVQELIMTGPASPKVTYVSNIYKYYIAYELIQKNLEQRERAKKEIKGSTPQ